MFLIHNHIEFTKKYHSRYVRSEYEEWSIDETDEHIEGRTMMDNFDMMWLLREIGVNEKYIDYDDQ
jgi:hypothetical protein